MIRIILAVIASLVAVTLYRVAETYSIHTAWLMLLAFATGLAFGVIFWLEFGHVGAEQSTNEPTVKRTGCAHRSTETNAAGTFCRDCKTHLARFMTDTPAPGDVPKIIRIR